MGLLAGITNEMKRNEKYRVASSLVVVFWEELFLRCFF